MWAVFATVIGLGMSVSAASAASVDVLFTATVEGFDARPGTPSPLHAGDTVTVRTVYDSAPVPTSPTGTYFPFSSVKVFFKGLSFDGTTDGLASSRILVIPDRPDQIIFKLFPPFPGVPGFDGIDLRFEDPTSAALIDNSFPTDLLHTTQSMTGRFYLYLMNPPFRGASDFVGVYGSITSVALTAQTPVPAALPLLATALGGLGFAGWRRRRSLAA